jgi:tetratricopeptide (TPR) repeat protein
MYNILLAAGAGVLAYLLGAAAAGWLAGIIPALLAATGAWILLARRTGKEIEKLFLRAQGAMQGGKLDEARGILESGMRFAKWQILVAEQIHSQLGMLDYVQGVGLHIQKKPTDAKGKFAAARAHFEGAWSRDWRAKMTLAIIHHREARVDDAVKVLEAASKHASGEFLFWAVYAFILNEARRRDEALQVLGRGLASNKDNKQLQALQEALANRKRPDFKAIGEPWWQLFPEDIPREVLMKMHGIDPAQAVRPQKTFPQPRGFGPPRR